MGKVGLRVSFASVPSTIECRDNNIALVNLHGDPHMNTKMYAKLYVHILYMHILYMHILYMHILNTTIVLNNRLNN